MHRFTRRRPIALALLCYLALAAPPPPPALAVPIELRARPSLSITSTPTREGLSISGTLVDDHNLPVAHAVLQLALGSAPPRAITTSSDGTFKLLIPPSALPPLHSTTTLTWHLAFPGNALLAATSADGLLDLRRPASRLTLHTPQNPLLLPAAPLELSARLATAEGVPIPRASLGVTVAGTHTFVTTTDAAGIATFMISPSALAAPGRYSVSVAFAGDLDVAPTTATTTLQLLEPTRLTLEVLPQGEPGQLGRLLITGRLSDAWHPLSDYPVVIVATHEETETRTTAIAKTAPDGQFTMSVSYDALHAAFSHGSPSVPLDLTLRASFLAPSAYLASTTARPRTVTIPAAHDTSSARPLIGLALLLIAIIFVHLARSPRLATLRKRLPSPLPSALPPSAGITLAPANRNNLLNSSYIAGKVVSASSLKGLPATLVITPPATPHGASPGSSQAPTGAFRLGPLPPGLYTVTAQAPGHLDYPFSVTLPHDGSYDGISIVLTEARAAIRVAFESSITHLGTPPRWGHDTPRESATRIRQQTPAASPPELSTLTTLVESAYFGAALPSSDDVAHAEALRTAIVARPESAP